MLVHAAKQEVSLDALTRVVLLLDRSPASEGLEAWLGEIDFDEQVDVEVHFTQANTSSRPALVLFDGDEMLRIEGRPSVAFYLSEIDSDKR